MTGLYERLALKMPTVTQQTTGYLFFFLSFKVHIVIYTLLILSWSNHCQLFILHFGHCGVKASLAMKYLTEKKKNKTKTKNIQYNMWKLFMYDVQLFLCNGISLFVLGYWIVLMWVHVVYSKCLSCLSFFFVDRSIGKHHRELARTQCRREGDLGQASNGDGLKSSIY